MCGPKCNYDEKRLIDANALHKRIIEGRAGKYENPFVDLSGPCEE